MTVSDTPRIDVDVATRYVAGDSEPDAGRYVFAYTITISHLGGAPAQLLNRHWVITNGDGDVEEVKGPGVVGEQPRLTDGQAFRYTSGAVLTTEVGSMRGSYEFRTDAGELFDVPIAVFSLSRPNAVH